MSWTVAQTTLMALLLGSVRAAAWLALCPPFQGRGLPPQGKALFSVAIALPVTPELARSVPSPMSALPMIADMAEQVVIGAALGFCTQLLVAAFQSAGGLIDLFGGFSVAFQFDPFSYSNNAVFGRFYSMAASALLFATDAYQMILAGFTRSYRILPLSGALSFQRLATLLTEDIGQMFLAAIQISGPLVAVLFLTDLVLGLLSRVSPSLNAFGLGFPAKILLTLVLAGMALLMLPWGVQTITDRAVSTVMTLLDGW